MKREKCLNNIAKLVADLGLLKWLAENVSVALGNKSSENFILIK